MLRFLYVHSAPPSLLHFPNFFTIVVYDVQLYMYLALLVCFCRVLIFTQMARVLDILEIFLNYHGHTYLRLDGATPVQKRQVCISTRIS